MNGSRSFFLLCAVGALCFASYNLVRMPVLSLFAQSLGAGPEQIGLIVSASTMTGVLLKLPGGALSDLYGRRRLLLVGLLAFALPPFLYPFVVDLTVLTGLRVAHGLATALFAPTALAAAAAWAPDRRGAALGWYTASTQAGALLGPLLGGWLAHGAGMAAAFVAAGVIGCAALALCGGLRLDQPLPDAGPSSVRALLLEARAGLRVLAGNRRLLVTSATEGARMIASGALMAFLPVYGLTVGMNAGEVGLLFGAQGIVSFLSKPAMGRASDRLGRRPLILIGLLLCAGSFALIPHATELPALLALAACFGFGEAVVTTSTAALVADLSDVRAMGAGMGVRGAIVDIGHAAGPLLGGVLIAGLGYAGAFAVIAAAQVGAALLFWAVVGRPAAPAGGAALL